MKALNDSEREKMLAELVAFDDESVMEIDPAERRLYKLVAPRSSAFAKFRAMVAAILSQLEEVSLIQLNKLLYYCDFAYYKKYGVAISGFDYRHLDFGPAPEGNRCYSFFEVLAEEKVLRLEKIRDEGLRSSRFSSTKKTARCADALSDREKHAIDYVVSLLGKKTASELSKMSHEEKGYKETGDNETIPFEKYGPSFSLDIPDAA